MIKMTDWRVHVPPGDGMLGYETETGVSRLAIQLDGTMRAGRSNWTPGASIAT